MSPPRLVATDLDGTLLDDEGLLSLRTQDVLRRVQELGVRVVIVTARPLRWMDELWAHVGGGRGVGIVSNGAITYDIGSREVLDHRGIAPEVGLPMVEAIREAAPGTAVALECLGGFRHEAAYVDLHPAPPDMRVGDLAEIWDEPAAKVLAQHLTLDPAEFRSKFDLAVMDVSFISVTKLLPAILPLLTPVGKMIVLIKPQFEVGKGEVGKGGIVREPEKHERVVAEINEFAVELGLRVKGVIESPILGAEGNKEFLALYERES